MAESTKLKVGDNVLVRWRDKNGTFDATNIKIAAIFNCDVPSVDNGQMYISLNVLQKYIAKGDARCIFRLISNETCLSPFVSLFIACVISLFHI